MSSHGLIKNKEAQMSKETAITYVLLDEYGFERFNHHFTYRSFPSPLYGNFRIDKSEHGVWQIRAYGEFFVREVETIKQVANFYKGICDLKLKKPKIKKQ